MGTINIADHVKPGDAERDLVPACRRAVQHLKSGDTLRFPEGEFLLLQEAAEQTLLAVTNHTVCARVHGILLRDRHDIAIDGNGCTLYADGLVSPLWLENCRNITIRDLILDRREYLNGSGLVTNAGDGWMELELDSRMNPNWFVHNGILTFQSRYWREQLHAIFEWDTDKRTPARGSADNCGGGWQVQWSAEHLDDCRIRLDGIFPHVPKVGNQMMLRCAKRCAPGVTLSRSRALLIEGVTVRACGGMAFIGQRCWDVTLRRCTVAPRPGGPRIDADCHDATHFANCAGKGLVEDCRFENQLDDASNVHGAYFRVLRKLDPRTLRVELRHHEQAGAPIGEAGDRFVLCDSATAESYWSASAAKVDTCNLTTADIAFDTALPDAVETGHVLDNVDWHPDFALRRCFMRGNRARGILVQTRGKVVIEENAFHSPGSAIEIRGAVDSWYESGPVRDVTIRRNVFDRCAYNAPIWGEAVFQIKGGRGGTTPFHRNIRIEDNKVICDNDNVLVLESVENVLFRNNELGRADGNPLGEWCRETESKDVKMEDNQ